VVVRFERGAQCDELPVQLRHLALHLLHRFGGADTSHDVLALGIDEVFAIHLVRAGAWIAREADAGGTIVTHVAKHHGDDVHRCPVRHGRRDVELAPVRHRSFARPGAEDGFDRHRQLLVDILRKRLPGLLLHHVQKTRTEVPQMGRPQARIRFDTSIAFDRFALLVEQGVRYPQGYLAKQVNEPPVGIVAKAFVLRLLE
jgi:hypothetical protein